jgi:hypothetical protein
MSKTRLRWSHPGRLAKNLVNNPRALVVRSDPQPRAGRERRKRVVDDDDNDDSEPAAKRKNVITLISSDDDSEPEAERRRRCVARARNRSRSHDVFQHANNEDSCQHSTWLSHQLRALAVKLYCRAWFLYMVAWCQTNAT